MSGGGGELHWWLEQCGRHPLLSAAEEIHLATMVQAWQQHPDPPRSVERRGARARDRMCTANLRLVVNIAKRYSHRHAELSDLVQCGNQGLIRAVERFDPTRGYKFSTYAYWWIRQGITRYLEESSRTIRHPSTFSQRLSSIDRATRELICGLRRSPTIEELAEALGMKPGDLSLVLRRGGTCVSLDAAMGGDDGNDAFSVVTADPNGLTSAEQLDEIAHQDRLDGLEDAMACLPVRQRQILIRRWGLNGSPPATIRAIALEHGVSPGRMSSELARATAALRVAAQSQASNPDHGSAKPAPGGASAWPDWRSGGRPEIVQLSWGDGGGLL